MVTIYLFRRDKPRKVHKHGVSKEEAQEYCSRESSHGDGWFYGYSDT
jgi:hypothetical protein